MVDNFLGAGIIEHREESAREHEDDERVKRNLPDHERPVIRKDMVQSASPEFRQTGAPIQPSPQCTDEKTHQDSSTGGLGGMPQNPGPGGVVNPSAARSVPSLST